MYRKHVIKNCIKNCQIPLAIQVKCTFIGTFGNKTRRSKYLDDKEKEQIKSWNCQQFNYVSRHSFMSVSVQTVTINGVDKFGYPAGVRNLANRVNLMLSITLSFPTPMWNYAVPRGEVQTNGRRGERLQDEWYKHRGTQRFTGTLGKFSIKNEDITIRSTCYQPIITESRSLKSPVCGECRLNSESKKRSRQLSNGK